MSERSTAKEEAKRQLVILVFAIIGYAVFLVMLDPDKLRTWEMRTVDVSRRLLNSTARQLGVLSMETELKTGREEYFLPYHLAVLRDKLATIYKRMAGNE
jgi:hypothetical protein